MFKFMTFILLLVMAFFAGRMWSMELPQEEGQEAVYTVPVIEATPYEQLTNREIMDRIAMLRTQEDSMEKFTTIAALIKILRSRIVA